MQISRWHIGLVVAFWSLSPSPTWPPSWRFVQLFDLHCLHCATTKCQQWNLVAFSVTSVRTRPHWNKTELPWFVGSLVLRMRFFVVHVTVFDVQSLFRWMKATVWRRLSGPCSWFYREAPKPSFSVSFANVNDLYTVDGRSCIWWSEKKSSTDF